MNEQEEKALIPFEEFRASLTSYVYRDAEGGVTDLRRRMLSGFIENQKAAQAVEMLEPCDVAAVLSGVVTPLPGGKLATKTAEAEMFLAAIRERENGVEYEHAIAEALEQAAQERDLRPLLTKRDGVVIEEAPADEPEQVQTTSEASSLFDSHEEGT